MSCKYFSTILTTRKPSPDLPRPSITIHVLNVWRAGWPVTWRGTDVTPPVPHHPPPPSLGQRLPSCSLQPDPLGQSSVLAAWAQCSFTPSSIRRPTTARPHPPPSPPSSALIHDVRPSRRTNTALYITDIVGFASQISTPNP